MKNRKLLLIVSLVLALTMSLGGTLAYLTDTASDVNTMTLGSVKIEQHEYQRADANKDGSYDTDTIDNVNSYVLEGYVNDKPLLPIVGDPNGGYDPTEARLAQLGHNSRGGVEFLNVKNAQDKLVVVENKGGSDAYVRTYVAIEAGSCDETKFDSLVNYNSHFTWNETQDWFITAINGNNYYIIEYVYNGYEDIQHPNGKLKAGDYSYPSLTQVYIKSEATNEDLEALDGNKNGKLDILVLSQAVQADGFADATTALNAGFGEATAANVKGWFEGKDFEDSNLPVVGEANNAQGITDAITAGADTVKLAAGKYTLPSSVSGQEVTFVGDEDTVINLSAAQGVNGADLTFKGVTIETTSTNYTGIQHSGDTKYEDVTFEGSTFLYGDSVVFENCTFNLTTNYIWTYGATTVTFNNCTFNTDGKAILVYKENGEFSQTVNVHNCTFNATKSGYASAVPTQPCAAVEIDSSLINGTYTVNFTGTNMVDSDFSGLVRIKSGAEKNNVTITGATAVALPAAE